MRGCSYHVACVRAAQSRSISASVLTIWQRKAGALQRVFLLFGMRVCSAERLHLSECSYHLARVCAVLSGRTSAGILSIWHACVQRKAGALQRVFLPFGTRVCSAERMHLSGCSYHLACVCVQRKAGALPGVFLPFGMRVCSAERLHLSECSYQFGTRVCSAKRVHFSGCSYGALQRVFLPFGMRVCSDQRVHFSGCCYHMACVCAVRSGCS